jgi:hypothetical protein
MKKELHTESNGDYYYILDKKQNKRYKNYNILFLSKKGNRIYPGKENEIINNTSNIFCILSEKPYTLSYNEHIFLIKCYLDNTIKTHRKINDINNIINFLLQYKDNMILKK